MIERELKVRLQEDAKVNAAVAVLGPRQSGKTTLVRATFPLHNYASLEELDARDFARTDPRGFLELNANEHGIILDEVQNAPDLLSYIQTSIDLHYKPGYFILTGSQNFLVTEAISQTLAGRVALHTLLPLSFLELSRAGLLSAEPEEVLFKGCYPPLYARSLDPTSWYTGYIRTYLEREVRTITAVSDLVTFKSFLGLCAGSTGQIVNLSSLGNNCGISYNTARSWLSILEASFIIFLLQPYYKKFNKRLIKAPKLYFYDTGLACTILGIESQEQLHTHYLRGGLFESMIIADLFKNAYNVGRTPRNYFWRDHTGHEIDCLVEHSGALYPIEIKAGRTISQDFFKTLSWWNDLTGFLPTNSYVIYAGKETQKRSYATVLPWNKTNLIGT
jgi:uncharacterized protein